MFQTKQTPLGSAVLDLEVFCQSLGRAGGHSPPRFSDESFLLSSPILCLSCGPALLEEIVDVCLYRKNLPIMHFTDTSKGVGIR